MSLAIPRPRAIFALLLATGLSSAPLSAAEDDPAPPPPFTEKAATDGPASGREPPLAAPQTDIPDTEITIRKEAEQTVEEYRSAGRVYMVKVTPKKFPPYYLVDNDGDGSLESRVSDPSTPPATPRWVLFRW